MNGFVAVTDPGWYARLSATPGPKDANFWRPSARAVRLAVGTPFLFKLKAPHHAIAGFGYFAGFSVLPDWLAWDTFGDANGVADLSDLRARLDRIRGGARIEADPTGRIGCCLIAECVFFREAEWVSPPRDWSPRIQTGASWDLAQGEGKRVWRDCLERALPRREGLRVSDSVEQPRFGAYSGRTWALIPATPGHRFRAHLGTGSGHLGTDSGALGR